MGIIVMSTQVRPRQSEAEKREVIVPGYRHCHGDRLGNEGYKYNGHV